MTDKLQWSRRTWLCAFVCMAVTAGAFAQERRAPALVESTVEFVSGDSPMAPTVRGVPYSGEATTTVTQMLGDGTRIERTTVTRLYRDSEGRLRREQTVLGLGPLSPSGEAPTIVTIVDPVSGQNYVLEPASRRARQTMVRRVQARGPGDRGALPLPAPSPTGRGVSLGPNAGSMPPSPPPPLPPQPPPAGESLGAKKIDGIDVVGTRYTAIIETGRIGNDRPIEIVDERWESPTLKVLVQSRHSDPRTGTVEYRLTNVTRNEPPHDLFVVPADYTIVQGRDERR